MAPSSHRAARSRTPAPLRQISMLIGQWVGRMGAVWIEAEITDLHVIFGSCRLVNNDHLDAMVWIDDLMAENPAYSYKEANKRPHQLFLGGDQIYADDVVCGHGATCGRIDEQMLFFLRSRGIPKAEAERMLVAEYYQRVFGEELPESVVAKAG